MKGIAEEIFYDKDVCDAIRKAVKEHSLSLEEALIIHDNYGWNGTYPLEIAALLRDRGFPISKIADALNALGLELPF